jgi:hypothetical protein
MDILLGDNHDIVFVNGSCPVTSNRTEAVAQRLLIKLKTFRGEWFLDTEYGIPYWQRILGRKVSKSAIDNIFQEKILEEKGVSEITSFSSTFEGRGYSLEFKVKVTSGDETDTITINTSS